MNAYSAASTLEVGGLPLHPLIVHAVVVLVPLTALGVVLGTVWPAARRRLGVVTPLAALLVVILVRATVAAGESLRDAVGSIPAIERHEAVGQMLLPWVVAMLVTTSVQWAWYRWGEPRPTAHGAARGRMISALLGVIAVVAAAGSVITVILTGESGARAVWGGLG